MVFLAMQGPLCSVVLAKFKRGGGVHTTKDITIVINTQTWKNKYLVLVLQLILMGKQYLEQWFYCAMHCLLPHFQ